MTAPAPYPVPAPRPSNGLGVAAFIISLVGIPVFCLAPVALLLSFIALFKRPRGFAFAGFVISFIVTAAIVAIFSVFGLAIFSGIKYGKPFINTAITAVEIQRSISAAHPGDSPDDSAGALLIAGKADGWGREFRYQKKGATAFEIRSASLDGIFDTDDDFAETFDVTDRR